ncbi:hypothetical protein QMG83_01715 [Salinibacterium sp. G-O1]|nr:hypothetical protein [Salinibacterium sp. G-O1]MDJ0333931.1 hypothetical protein [Salinibacterium sp. G-O1]
MRARPRSAARHYANPNSEFAVPHSIAIAHTDLHADRRCDNDRLTDGL